MPNVLEPIKGKELDSLSLTDLVIRMDKVLEISQLERYENLPSEVLSHYLNLKPTVMEFLSTKLVSQKSPDQQRFLVWLFFGFLVQMELATLQAESQTEFSLIPVIMKAKAGVRQRSRFVAA